MAYFESQRNEDEGRWCVKILMLNGKSYVAFSSSSCPRKNCNNECEGNGTISFASNAHSSPRLSVEYIFKRSIWHPSSMAQVGNYVLWIEKQSELEKLYVADTSKLTDYANCSTPCTVPYRAINDFPYIQIDGISTGGGGIAIARLFNGKYLLAVGPSGGFNGEVIVRFYILHGNLGEPENMFCEFLDELDFVNNEHGFEEPGERPIKDENLSFLTDEDGRIFLYLPSFEKSACHRDADGNCNKTQLANSQMYLYFYEIVVSKIAENWSVQAEEFDKISAYSQEDITFGGGTSATVNERGSLEILTADMKINYFSDIYNQNFWWAYPYFSDKFYQGILWAHTYANLTGE